MKTVCVFIVLLLIGLGFSCKKKSYPESTEDNTVIYYFNATINNQAVTLNAGKDDYYMYSSIQQDQNIRALFQFLHLSRNHNRSKI
jgi:hypothetical protein